MKKLLGIFLAAAMVASLAACGSTSDSESQAPSGSEGASGGAAAGGKLKVAAIETAYGADMWNKVVEAFKADNPGVEVELITDKNLEDVISAPMKAGAYPDVIHLATGRPAAMTETLIKENGLEDITDVLSMTVPGESVTVGEKIIPGFTDTSVTNPYGDGKTYLAPMFYGPCGLFYNAGLMQEKGWTVPTTWDEMWALGEQAKAEGIALFTYPTTGYFDAFFYALMYEAGGTDFFEKATTYSEGIWDTDAAKACFDTVTKLASYTEKSTPANANNDNFTKNQQLVIDGKALFMPNGNWVIGEMKESTPEGYQWGFMALPALTEGGDRYSYTFFEQAWIPAAAPNKELAKKFVAFLYSDKAAEIFAEAGAIQPIKGMTDKLEGDQKIYYGIYETGAKAALGAFAATDPVEGVSMADSLFGTVNSLVSGDKTQDQWIAAVKEASDALRPALKA